MIIDILQSLVDVENMKHFRNQLRNKTIVYESFSSEENKLTQNNVTLPISPVLLKPKLRVYLLGDLSLFKCLWSQLSATILRYKLWLKLLLS